MAGELIMIVEDEELIALEMNNAIVSWGFTTITVRSGEEALLMAAEARPALALMDVKLSGAMDGIEAAALLRERHGVAVIFITAFSDMAVIDRAKLTMPFSFMVKPVQDQELRASIETALYLLTVEEARNRAELELRAARDGLEVRVRERTGELQKANELLRESEERYRALFENARIGIGIISLEGKILTANPAMAAILGYSMEYLQTVNIRNLYADPADRDLLLERLEEHGTVADFETALRHKNGSIIHVNFFVNRIVWNNRETLHEVMEDITERKQALNALIQAHADLERRVAERTAELAGANRFLEAEIDERKRAEEATRNSEAKFRAVVENSYDGIIFCDAEGNVLYRSPSYTAINGFTDIERIGKTVFEMVHPDDTDEVRQKWMQMLEYHDNIFHMELRIQHKDGTWRWVDSTAKNMLEDPSVRSVIVVSHDITGRKKNELALREMNGRLELTLNASGAGSWDWNIATGDLVWSPKMFELFGLDGSATETSFDVWRSVVHPDDLDAAEAWINRALEDRTDLINEYRVIRPDGRIVWIYALGKGVYDRGRPIRMGGICIDITRRKEMEEQVRLSEEKFSKAFMASPEAITIATIDEGLYLDVNEAFLGKTGFEREEVIGRSSTDINVWVTIDDRNRYINELITTSRLRNFEVQFRMKSGEIRDFIVSGEIITIFKKRCSLNFIIDITDRKRAEAILRQEHENFLKIFSMAPVGLLLLDADRVITHANSAVGAIVLRDPAEIIGRRAGGGIGCVHSLEDPRGCGFSTSCPECPLRISIEAVLAGGTPVINNEVKINLLIDGVPRERWLTMNAESVVIEGKQNIILAVGDISDIKKAEEVAEIERELLNRCNRAGSVRDLIQSLTLYLKNIVGCEAAGVRLRDGDDYPYYETHGFTEEFVLAENTLCARDSRGEVMRDELGNPVLDCMCGNILCNRFDPSKHFFSPGGSFWSSCTSELLATTTEADRQARTRNRCNGEGYESVALIPIRVKDEVVGLFQFNDRRKGLYTAQKIEWMEHLVDFVAISLAKLLTDENLRRSEEQYRTVADFTFDWEFWISPEEKLLYVSPSCERVTGYSPAEFIANPGLMLEIVHPNDVGRIRGHFSDPEDISCEKDGLDYRIVRKDGEVRWIGHRCQIVYGGDGRRLGRRGSQRDITDRKRAEEEIVRLNRHIITLQEQERQRVAKDLHDGVSQMMNAAKLNFAGYRQDPVKNRERFETGMEFIDLASRELREVYSNLYPSVLEDLGLAAAVRLYTKKFLANRGIDAEVTIDEDLNLPVDVQIDLYRIIQESCSNIARHSGADRALVALYKRDGYFVLQIDDNGAGFDPAAPRSSEGGFGIINMKQRIKHLDGSFKLDTGSSGTRITITIPGEGIHG